jgi:hypothetical protein
VTGELVGHITLEKYQAARSDTGFCEALLPQAVLGRILERFKGGINKHVSGERLNVYKYPKSNRGKRKHCTLG